MHVDTYLFVIKQLTKRSDIHATVADAYKDSYLTITQVAAVGAAGIARIKTLSVPQCGTAVQTETASGGVPEQAAAGNALEVA